MTTPGTGPAALPSAPDDAGLICAYLFDGPDGGGAARAVDAAEAAQWLAGEKTPAAFLWLHFNLNHTQAERWMLRHAGLSDTFYETLKDGTHSTRIERDEDALIAVVNDVHFDFGFEPSDIATLWASVGPQLVVTARTQPLRTVDALRTAVRNGQSPRSSVALLEQLMRTQADGLVDIVRGVTTRIDGVEDELLSGRLDHKRARLGVLRRLLVRLQRLLAPEPASLFRLLQHPPAWMAEDDVQELRGATEEFSVVLRDMQGLQERIKLLQEEIAASVNEDNGRSLFVLTVVTVLALPINILAGLFGMNVGGIPLADHPHGFWIVVTIVLGFTVVAAWLALRRKDG
ncbi:MULTISPECIES: transporter [unclassified Variovorax]|uniref:transporter n=1 Tax=unclassified Variovorax TaxID=663243 RepID=UPI0025762B92|nr:MULTISPECIES: transporter [unclassified Variovorax]MDM0088613.1 transporter [Variovorax sp. J22G40]MDM0146686.1 transporter [Variovorax sp. J2P1-31]